MNTPETRNTVADVNWWSYVTGVTGTHDQKDIAATAGVDQSTVSRWKSTGKPGRPDNVAALARGYRRPVLEAFVAAGFLTGAEAKERPTERPSLSSLTDDQLVDEIRRRMRRRGEGDGTAMNVPDDDDLEAAQDVGRAAVRKRRGARESGPVGPISAPEKATRRRSS